MRCEQGTLDFDPGEAAGTGEEVGRLNRKLDDALYQLRQLEIG